jgi:hypothetical protein
VRELTVRQVLEMFAYARPGGPRVRITKAELYAAKVYAARSPANWQLRKAARELRTQVMPASKKYARLVVSGANDTRGGRYALDRLLPDIAYQVKRNERFRLAILERLYARTGRPSPFQAGQGGNGIEVKRSRAGRGPARFPWYRFFRLPWFVRLLLYAWTGRR